MAKKRSKVVSKAKPQDALNRKKFLARLPKTKKEHLELLLFFTERAISGHNGIHFVGQAERIRKEIADLRASAKLKTK